MRRFVPLFVLALALSGLSSAFAAAPEQSRDADVLSLTSMDSTVFARGMLGDVVIMPDSELNLPDPMQGHDMPPNPCAKVGLTPAQMTMIRDGMLETEKAKARAEADLKISHLEFMQLALNQNATMDQGQAGAMAIAQNMGKMAAIQTGFRANILFHVLTAAQREPGMACEMFMHKMMMMHKLMQACKLMPHHNPHEDPHHGEHPPTPPTPPHP